MKRRTLPTSCSPSLRDRPRRSPAQPEPTSSYRAGRRGHDSRLEPRSRHGTDRYERRRCRSVRRRRALLRDGEPLRGLPWNAIPAADWAILARRQAGGRGRRARDSSDPSSIERRLVSSSCGGKPSTAGELLPLVQRVAHRRAGAARTELQRRRRPRPGRVQDLELDAGLERVPHARVRGAGRRRWTSSPSGRCRSGARATISRSSSGGSGSTRTDDPRRTPTDAGYRPTGGCRAARSPARRTPRRRGPLGGWRDAADPSYRGARPATSRRRASSSAASASTAHRRRSPTTTARSARRRRPSAGRRTTASGAAGRTAAERGCRRELALEGALRDVLLRRHPALVAGAEPGQLPRRSRPREVQLSPARTPEHVLRDPDREPRQSRAAADDERAPAEGASVLEPVLPRLHADRDLGFDFTTPTCAQCTSP